jgi:hypothetical protein
MKRIALRDEDRIVLKGRLLDGRRIAATFVVLQMG